MGHRAYLDHNATTPLRPTAAQAMARALGELAGNPSSIHAEGRAARAAIDRARRQVAEAVGGEARNVIFTSGATEALNTLLRPSTLSAADGRRATRLLALATEHSAVLAGGGFAPDETGTVAVDGNGLIDLQDMESRLAAFADDSGRAPVILAVQAANSETGVIQPIDAVSRLARRFGALLVCDAVAAVGRLPVDIRAMGVDALVLSAHKFGGPMGAGAIVFDGGLVLDRPLLRGGGQERGLRSGTQNVPAIVGMGEAIAAATASIGLEPSRQQALRDRLLKELRAARPDLVVFGESAPRLPNTLNVGVPGLTSETAVIAFDLAGVAVSSGSACSSGKVKRSHVLDAMGVERSLAEGALRFSLGWTTTDADIDRAAAAFAKIAGAPAQRHEIAA